MSVVDEALAKQAAALAVSGASQRAIADALSISPKVMSRISRSDAFKNEVKLMSEQSIEQALGYWKAAMEKLTRKAIDVFHAKLDEGNLQAAITVAQMSGALDKAKPQEKVEQTIQIVMGSTPVDQKPVIEVDSDDV